MTQSNIGPDTAFESAEFALGYYDEAFRHFSAIDALEMLATMKVQKKIADATFTFVPANWALEAVVRNLSYGIGRENQDHVASNEKFPTAKSKIDEVSLRVGQWESGIYVAKRLRGTALGLEDEIKCRIVLQNLSDDDVKRMKDMEKDKRADYLLGLYEDNAVGDDDSAVALRAEFESRLAEANRPKPKIAIKVRT